MKKFLIITAYFALFMLAVLNCEEAGKKDADQPKDDTVTEQPAKSIEDMQAADTTPAETEQPAPEAEDVAMASESEKEAKAEPEPQASNKPMPGKVVSLKNMVFGGNENLTKAQATNMVAQGEPIVFLSGGKIYFVYNEDGTFAGEKLAKYSIAEQIGIIGDVKRVKGVNVIIAKMIQKM